jgi:aminocarboxymuconate-semialdehyde decarboxylase
MDWGWRWRPQARTFIDRLPSTYLSRFYYDCITHDERALRYIIDTVGIDRVVFGSDYPGFAAGQHGTAHDPRAWLLGLQSLSTAEKKAILGENLAQALSTDVFST